MVVGDGCDVAKGHEGCLQAAAVTWKAVVEPRQYSSVPQLVSTLRGSCAVCCCYFTPITYLEKNPHSFAEPTAHTPVSTGLGLFLQLVRNSQWHTGVLYNGISFFVLAFSSRHVGSAFIRTRHDLRPPQASQKP